MKCKQKVVLLDVCVLLSRTKSSYKLNVASDLCAYGVMLTIGLNYLIREAAVRFIWVQGEGRRERLGLSRDCVPRLLPPSPFLLLPPPPLSLIASSTSHIHRLLSSVFS